MTTSVETEGRSGNYVSQPEGYRAFIPSSLPPIPPLAIDQELLKLVADANLALGKLNAAATILPNQERFVSMYARKEAVLSSEIEGTQASLSDVLEYEATRRTRIPAGVREVRNYIRSMDHGMHRLSELPLCNRLFKEIHAELLKGARGGDKTPGEFRTRQNWLGPYDGAPISEAFYVPPPADEIDAQMGDLETYINQEPKYPDLIEIGLIHAQFETIHPFLDGNGRMGRLLITFYLCQRGVLDRPLLYVSAYLREYQAEYYARLQAVRDHGDWEGWLKFFLTAVWKVALEASERVNRIIVMREDHRHLIQSKYSASTKGVELLDILFERPYLQVNSVSALLGIAYPTANGLMAQLSSLGLVREVTGQMRGRVFCYTPYVELLNA